MRWFRPILTILGLLLTWQVLVWLSGVEPFILPGPDRVLTAWVNRSTSILPNALVTFSEILLGFLLGGLGGALAALAIAQVGILRRWLLPVLVISQAIPVFALAPLLVLWFGYGMASKVIMAVLIIFFPVTAAFYDGLRRTEPGWLDLARTMTAGRPHAGWALLRHIRIPAALPACATGLRVAAAVAPIGAVIGEWVGSSAGLGYMMLQANARMQVDVMFAALLTLTLMAAGFYFAVDALLRRALPWQADTINLH